jgi:hypothetical protein
MEPDEKEQSNIPLFGTWNKWYAFLLVVLLVQVLLYTWLTYSYL